MSVEALLDGLAAKSPTPGGGAVAPLAGALAASLTAMVVNYTVGKKKYAEHDAAHQASLAHCARIRGLLMQLADEDVAAYAALNDLMSRPEDDAERIAEMPAVALAATQVPLAALAACCDHLRHARTLVGCTNRMLRSDLAIAAILAQAGAEAAYENVKINLPLLEKQGLHAGVEEEADTLVRTATTLAAEIREHCA